MKKLLIFLVSAFLMAAQANAAEKTIEDAYKPFIDKINQDIRSLFQNDFKLNQTNKCIKNENLEICKKRIAAYFEDLYKLSNDALIETRDISLAAASNPSESNIYFYQGSNDLTLLLYGKSTIRNRDGKARGPHAIPIQGLKFNDERCKGFLLRAIQLHSGREWNPFRNTGSSRVDPNISYVLADLGAAGREHFINFCNSTYTKLPSLIQNTSKNIIDEIDKTAKSAHEASDKENLSAQEKKSEFEKTLTEEDLLIGKIVRERGFNQGNLSADVDAIKLRAELLLKKKLSLANAGNIDRLLNESKIRIQLLNSIYLKSRSASKGISGKSAKYWVEPVVLEIEKTLPENLPRVNNWFVEKALSEVKWKEWRTHLQDDVDSPFKTRAWLNRVRSESTGALVALVKDTAQCGVDWQYNRAAIDASIAMQVATQQAVTDVELLNRSADILINICLSEKPEWSGLLEPGIGM